MAGPMLACRAVKPQTTTLRPPGALSEQTAQVVVCTKEPELLEVFAQAVEQGTRLTLIGGQRSFGEQFLPIASGLGVDISRLERGARVQQEFEDGRLLVRAGGGTRFED